MLKLNKNGWVLIFTNYTAASLRMEWLIATLDFPSARHAIFQGSSRNYIEKLRDQWNEAFYARSPAVQLFKNVQGKILRSLQRSLL